MGATAKSAGSTGSKAPGTKSRARPEGAARPRPAVAGASASKSLVRMGDVLEATVRGLGYELVDYEIANRGSLVRVFIERPDAKIDDPLSGVRVEDCEKVTRQLQHVFTVENVDYDRLEVSSPGLDRVLSKPADFRKFSGQEAELRLRVPVGGRRRFTGVVRGIEGDAVQLEVAGVMHSFAMTDLEKARLVPRFPGPKR